MVVIDVACNCGASFIEKTSGNLITRLNNHNIDLSLRQENDVAKHQVENPTHEIDFNSCEILGFPNHWRKRLIKKSLYI